MYSDTHPKILAFTSLFLLFIGVLLYTSTRQSVAFTLESVEILLCVALLSFAIFQQVSAGGTNIDLSPFRPEALYGFFYLIYYGVPAILLSTSSEIAPIIVAYEVEIAAMLLVGFLCFVGGVRFHKAKLHLKMRSQGETYGGVDGTAMVVLSYLCLGLLLIHFVRRIQGGYFFEHGVVGGEFLHRQTVSESVFEVFAGSLYLPIPFFLVAAMRSKSQAVSNHAYCLLLAAGSILTLIFVLSSQFRYALTMVLLCVICLQVSGRLKVKWRHLVVAGALGLFSLGVIKGMRAHDGGRMRASSNQLQESIGLAREAVFTLNADGVLNRGTVSRATGSFRFLAEIMAAVERGTPTLNGRLFVDSIQSMIPRVIWSEKPRGVSVQIYLRREFGLVVHDDPPSPLVSFYANGGWIGIAAGFFALGWFLSAIGQAVLRSKSGGAWIFLGLTWTSVLQFEQEVVLSLLGFLRTALVLYLVYTGLKWFLDLVLGPVFAREQQVVGFSRWHHGNVSRLP